MRPIWYSSTHQILSRQNIHIATVTKLPRCDPFLVDRRQGTVRGGANESTAAMPRQTVISENVRLSYDSRREWAQTGIVASAQLGVVEEKVSIEMELECYLPSGYEVVELDRRPGEMTAMYVDFMLTSHRG